MAVPQLQPVAPASVAREPEHPRVITARRFLADFQPIETLVEGLPIPRGGLVSVTGPTGSGKTTLMTLLQLSIRTGRPFAGRQIDAPGSVIVMAGENPDDYGMHLLGTVQHEGIDPQTLSDVVDHRHMMVIPGVFDLRYQLDWLTVYMEETCPDVRAVFVDTSAAFYYEGDENDNVAMRQHASTLRELTNLPGRPTVFVLCHPVKTAQQDNLLPRGGGAFLAEVDANLTVWKDAAGIVSLHWAGKIRGSSFDPLRFELKPWALQGHADARGRPITTVVASHLADDRAEQLEAKALDDENRLLVAMQRKPGGSVADLAMAGGFTTGVGQPHKSKVSRLLGKLKEQGLAEKTRAGVWQLTNKGRNEADRLP